MERPFILSHLPGFTWLPGERATALPGLYGPEDCRLSEDPNEWPRCLWLYTPDLEDEKTINLIIEQTGVEVSEDGQGQFNLHHRLWSKVLDKKQYHGPSKAHVLIEFLQELKFFTKIK